MKYSIVVATYNRREALKSCVESILNQTHSNFELLVVDDGSTDRSDELMNDFTDSRVRYIPLDRNYGTATPARNRGIEEMEGDALIIWDSDDVLSPHALENINKGFLSHPDVGIVCASTDFYLEGEKQSYARSNSFIIKTEDWFAGLKPRDAEVIAIKKELIQETRFESRGIDFMFYAKIVAKNQASTFYLNQVCGKVYLESDQLSLTIARRKRNPRLSIERAPILEDFITRYGHWFSSEKGRIRIAGHAFGAAVGYILAGDYTKGKQLLRLALRKQFRYDWLLISIVLHMPMGGSVLRLLLFKI